MAKNGVNVPNHKTAANNIPRIAFEKIVLQIENHKSIENGGTHNKITSEEQGNWIN